MDVAADNPDWKAIKWEFT